MHRLLKTFRATLYGIMMSIFFFSSIFGPIGFTFVPQAAAQNQPAIPVIFATTANLSGLPGDLSGAKLLYQNSVLAPTYQTSITQAVFDQLKTDARIEFIQEDYPVFSSAVIPDDPYFTVNETEEEKQWYLKKIKLDQAWEYGTGSKHIKVAIVDTGIHASHIEFDDGRVIAGYNVLNDSDLAPGKNSDDNGHGTAVSGVIGAITDNNRGIAGINWDISLMPVKALSADGSGSVSSLSKAIVWAADHDADIINLSLGGPGFGANQALNRAIIYAHDLGVLVIAAAGNDLAEHGINLDTQPVYPICSDGGNNMVIGVAASDINDQKASFSNFGINCVDITAPGKRILTTGYLPSDPSDNVLLYGSGTSLAAPIVSGVAALLKSNNPSLSPDQLRNILLKSTDNIDALNPTQCLNTSCAGFLGHGRINALSALSPVPVLDGSLMRQIGTGNIYLIQGGKKRLIPEFVFKQRGYNLTDVVDDQYNQLRSLTDGKQVLPLDGTLVKSADSDTVYVIHQELKRPLTYLVFQSRGFSFANVVTLPASDIYTIRTGEWYWPPDGTMVLIKDNPTVYVMDDAVKRPVTYFVFIQRRLSFAKVISVSQDEFSHIPAPLDQYWLPPLNNTLVKASDNDTVYLIIDNTRQAITYEAFVARGLDFNNIKTIPQAEIDVIMPGAPIIN